MDKEKLERYRERLLDERDKVSTTIDGILGNGLEAGQKDELDELSSYDNHPGDMGTEMFDAQKRYALVDNEQVILENIDGALKRLDEGNYGVCELCGRPIDEERLDFLPYANTCVECANKSYDYQTFKYDRPVEEEVLSYPFGRTFLDETDINEYDGEDSWQDVDKYNKRQGIFKNYDDNYNLGCVEDIENISNQQYRDQLP